MASLVMLAYLAGFLFLGSATLTDVAAVEGVARVVDGDSLVVAGQAIDLYGIDAPELGQTCWDERGEFPCGLKVKQMLESEVAGETVTCSNLIESPFGGIQAVCRDRDSIDLGWDMVRHGWAMADREDSLDYLLTELRAQAMKRGLWRTRFALPWEWRARTHDYQ